MQMLDAAEDRTNYGFYIPFDEFNTLIYSSLLAKKIKERLPNVKLTTVAFESFLPLYQYFDEILFLRSDPKTSPIDEGARDPRMKTSFTLQAQQLLERRNLKAPALFEQVESHVIKEFGVGIHERVIKMLIEHLLDKGPLLEPSILDLESVDKFLESKEITEYNLVLGRNRIVHPHHNNLLETQICGSISNEVHVINATFPRPNLESQYPKRYTEVVNDLNSYGFTLALMKRAHMTYAYGNAGGISIHLLTNFPVTVVGPMNWVGSMKYSYSGKTLFSARRSVGIETHHSSSGVRKMQLVKSLLRITWDYLNYYQRLIRQLGRE